VALLEIGCRRWVVSAYGETHWVRNLRSASDALLRVDGRDEPVHAVELSPAEAMALFRDVLVPYLATLPLHLRIAGRVFARGILADPERAAARRPVFELISR
jgi:hypothetical protein